MLFNAMTLKDASNLYDNIQQNMTPCNFKYNLLDDLVFFTENFTRDYGSPMKKVKYYVEITHCEDCTDFSIQSKWFDTYEETINWYKNNIDFLNDDYDAYIMYAEWDVTSDSYGDIELYEMIDRRILL